MINAANFDGLGVGTDEEEPVVAYTQSQFFSTLKSFDVAGA